MEFAYALFDCARKNILTTSLEIKGYTRKKDTIDYIARNEGYYIAPVKGNQEALENNLIEYFSDNKLYNEAKNEKTIVSNKGEINAKQSRYLYRRKLNKICKSSKG